MADSLQTFANDEGDDPSRVGAASDPLMDGIEQLDVHLITQNKRSSSSEEIAQDVVFRFGSSLTINNNDKINDINNNKRCKTCRK